MRERLSNNQKYRVSIKKLVIECKSVSLTQTTANGISRYQIQKDYQKQLDILFPLVVSRESSDLSNMIEPFFDTVNQRAEAKTPSNEVIKVVNQNRKSSMKKQKENTLEQVTVNSTRSFIDNKATGKLLNSLDDENKSLRRHNIPK